MSKEGMCGIGREHGCSCCNWLCSSIVVVSVLVATEWLDVCVEIGDDVDHVVWVGMVWSVVDVVEYDWLVRCLMPVMSSCGKSCSGIDGGTDGIVVGEVDDVSWLKLSCSGVIGISWSGDNVLIHLRGCRIGVEGCCWSVSSGLLLSWV